MNWLLRQPPYDSQYSGITHTDVFDCTAESLAHMVYFLTGWWVSPRDLAISARLDITANRTVEHVLSIANSVGLTSYQNCPTPASFTFSSYYDFDNADLPHQRLNIELVTPDINVSPFWEELAWGLNLPVPTRHLVCGIDTLGNYFDSEPGNPVKNIKDASGLGASPATIVWQSSIKINNPPMNNQSKVVLSQDGKTIYVATPIATDWANFLKQASVEGIEVPTTPPPSSSL